ncbi:MAG: SDR family oxidoreductase [Chlamydiia bacterium]|nr:SDR family oxidoreductase [Chlamydiia bacterium]
MTKTVLITGGNRGIGLEMVRQYSALGYRVIACCRNPQSAKELLQIAPYALLELDVMKLEHIERIADQLKHETIDILINNAGITGPPNEEFNWKNPAPWLEGLHVMTLAPYIMAQALQLQLEKSSSKLVVNISSVYGSIALNQGKGDYLIYRSSKAALNATTKCLANHWKEKGIVVLALHPGFVKTEMNPYGKISVSTSVKEIRKTLSLVTKKDTGTFIDYLGNPIPW